MGLAASQARYMLLTQRKTNLEFTGQQINQARLALANEVSQLFDISANLDPTTKEAIRVQNEIGDVQAQDKALELQLRRVDTQQQAVSTELDAVKKVIDGQIDRVFKTFA